MCSRVKKNKIKIKKKCQQNNCFLLILNSSHSVNIVLRIVVVKSKLLEKNDIQNRGCHLKKVKLCCACVNT